SLSIFVITGRSALTIFLKRKSFIVLDKIRLEVF
ncbi:MAG: hypothetical protein ACI934_001106, partial [Pseudohongiellaceae bacterium]